MKIQSKQPTLFEFEEEAIANFDMTLGDWVNSGPDILFYINRVDEPGRILVLATRNKERHDKQLKTGRPPIPIMPEELLCIMEAIAIGKTEDEVMKAGKYTKDARRCVVRSLDMKIKYKDMDMKIGDFNIVDKFNHLDEESKKT